jgi:hypothetical protein
MKTYKGAQVALAAAALFTAGHAFAAAEATATISNLKITLIDLNPGDGIDAKVTFASGFSSNITGTLEIYQEPFSSGFSISSKSFASLNQSSSSLEGLGIVSAYAGKTNLGVHGEVEGSGTSLNINRFTASATAVNTTFTLTPYTAMVWTADVAVDAQIDAGFPLWGFSESAFASASLALTGPAVAGEGSQSSASSFHANAGSDYDHYDPAGPYGAAEHRVGMLGASFTNATATSMQGTASLNAQISGTSSVSPVPETSTASLMLAGLGTLGLLLRRRRIG